MPATTASAATQDATTASSPPARDTRHENDGHSDKGKGKGKGKGRGRGTGRPRKGGGSSDKVAKHAMKAVMLVFDWGMWILGPCLVVLATVLISFVVYAGTTVVLPSQYPRDSILYKFHCSIAVFLGFNIVFNYFSCVTTNPGTHVSKLYARLLREAQHRGDLRSIAGRYDAAKVSELLNRFEGDDLGDDANSKRKKTSFARKRDNCLFRSIALLPCLHRILPFLREQNQSDGDYELVSPTTGDDSVTFPTSSEAVTESNWREKMGERERERENVRERDKRKGNEGHVHRPTESWMDRMPGEWSVCKRTGLPKAPRSHYDSVTKKLVLNMDHYCPWMFNCVGYGNYRYFFLFLLWLFIGCFYAACMSIKPFMAYHTRHKGLRSIIRSDGSSYALGREFRTQIVFTFVICLSVGIAVLVLLSWHVYLILTAQTTIEFYGNRTSKRHARTRGKLFTNPYDQGTRANWEAVMGKSNVLLSLLPSWRRVPWGPYPQLSWDGPHVV